MYIEHLVMCLDLALLCVAQVREWIFAHKHKPHQWSELRTSVRMCANLYTTYTFLSICVLAMCVCVCGLQKSATEKCVRLHIYIYFCRRCLRHTHTHHEQDARPRYDAARQHTDKVTCAVWCGVGGTVITNHYSARGIYDIYICTTFAHAHMPFGV